MSAITELIRASWRKLWLCRFTYHASGQLQNEDYTSGLLNALGVHRTFDSLSRLSGLAMLAPGYSLPATSYTYDAASRLSVVTQGANSATYGYLTNSPLVSSVTFQQGGTTRLTTTKTYDNLNRLGLITSVPSASSAVSVAYDYNSANQRTKLTRENNAYWSYGYDALGQVTSAKKYLPGVTLINGLDHAWTFDDIGNRKTATVNSQPSTYSANSLNQYTQRTVPGVIDVMGAAQSAATVTVMSPATNGTIYPVTRQGELFYRQLSMDNTAAAQYAQVKVTGVKNNVGPNGEDAVAQETRNVFVSGTPEVFTHDADGNLTSDAKWIYTWDGESRLVAVETSAAAVTAGVPKQKLEFVYDGQGRRFSKKVYNWNGTAYALASSTLFLYDGWNLIAEFDSLSTLTLTRSYVWGLDLSGSLQGAGGVGGLLFSTLNSQLSTHASAFDGNGNVIGLVDMATGNRSATYEYGAFGETLVADGSLAEAFVFRFSTKYLDVETGLYYYGLRYYNPGTGRWLSRDPATEKGGVNIYGMVYNDAQNKYDYLGLWNRVVCSDAGKREALNRAELAALAIADEAAGKISDWNLSKIQQDYPSLFRVKSGVTVYRPVAFHTAFLESYSRNLNLIRSKIRSGMVIADGCSDPQGKCGKQSGMDTYAYTFPGGTTIWFCPSFFNESAQEQVDTVLHEYSHLAASTDDGEKHGDLNNALGWPFFAEDAYFYGNLANMGSERLRQFFMAELIGRAAKGFGYIE